MSPSLENCPNEVIESIVVLLGLSDICSLRQSSRALASKTTQNHFESYFLSKHVDITGSAFRAFVDVTARLARLPHPEPGVGWRGEQHQGA
jgi:hypothetical protein